jgi:MerR family mercuric resistance operon transcriptional regulator
MRQEGIGIGELARQTSCNIETIRYYERSGLLPLPERQGRFRRYTSIDVRRVTFVRRARGLGFSLDEVRALLALSATDSNISAKHLADVRARITDLKAMERVLAAAIRHCSAGERPGCPLIEALCR